MLQVRQSLPWPMWLVLRHGGAPRRIAHMRPRAHPQHDAPQRDKPYSRWRRWRRRARCVNLPVVGPRKREGSERAEDASAGLWCAENAAAWRFRFLPLFVTYLELNRHGISRKRENAEGLRTAQRTAVTAWSLTWLPAPYKTHDIRYDLTFYSCWAKPKRSPRPPFRSSWV